MPLLLIICALVFIASSSFGIFYLINGIIKKDPFYKKTSLICLGIAIISIAIPFICIAGEISEAFSN